MIIPILDSIFSRRSVRTSTFYLIIFLGFFNSLKSLSQSSNRPIPAPLPSHPGNIFLEGEKVSIKVHKNNFYRWKLFDYDSKLISQVETNNGYVTLGKLPIGYYELRLEQNNLRENPIIFGVVSPLKVPTPHTSPIGLDVGLSVFYSGEERTSVANLCTLAGVNWVRDRFNWSEIEPEQGIFVPSSIYDEALKIQSSARLNILQVNHTSPKWANIDSHRFPNDLRAVFNFYKKISQRWKNLVYSFEPWNEANLEDFGGHIGSEIASFQKVAYLGLKAGNPQVSVAFNPIARPKLATLADLHENQIEAYFDTFNFHHYNTYNTYPNTYEKIRRSSANKPLWVSETNLAFLWTKESEKSTTINQDLKIQSERVASIYAATLNEGASAVFYFLLPNYSEGGVQFGLLHKNLTPRPAFIAMAAVGRILADAKPLGQVKHSNSNIYSFLFRARPDGVEKDILVSWTLKGNNSILLPTNPSAILDHLGRTQINLKKSNILKLSTAPIFAIFPKNSWKNTKLTTFPKLKSVTHTLPSSVVLQASLPKSNANLDKSAYQITSKKIEKIPIFVYNFSPHSIQGKLKVFGSSKCVVDLFPGSIKLFSGERKQLILSLDCRKILVTGSQKVTLRGDFGSAGTSILSLRTIHK
jgi:hypothetical protein